MRKLSRLMNVRELVATAAIAGVLGLGLVAAWAATTMNTVIDAKITAVYRGSSALGPQRFSIGADQQPSIALNNSDAGEIYSVTTTLASAGTATLDLTALTDPIGNAINFARIKAIRIKASINNSTTLTVGSAGSNPILLGFGGTTPTWAIGAGGVFLVVNPASAGWPVSSSAKNLLVTNGSGAPATYDITIVGAQ